MIKFLKQHETLCFIVCAVTLLALAVASSILQWQWFQVVGLSPVQSVATVALAWLSIIGIAAYAIWRMR
jgi:hypothetical protein